MLSENGRECLVLYCDDNYSYYPMQNPAPLFEVVDSRVSKYWRFELSPEWAC
jgi:hypothetical protein